MKIKVKVKKILSISLLQLVVFINSWRSKADAEMVEGCVYSTLTLTCSEKMVINVSSVVLGDTPGCPDANCCPKNDSCTAKPNDNHVNDVHRRCNRRQRCTVDVIREKIPCESTFYINHNNDFERITYDCIDNGNISAIEDYTDETTYVPVVTVTRIIEDALTSRAPGMLNGTEPMTIVIVIVCLLVLIIIIVLIIAIVKLRKTHSSKIKSEVEMTDVGNGQNGIYANQTHDINRNPDSSASRQNDGQNCSSAIYAEPNNVVEYSVVSQETTSPAAKGAGVEYCSVDIIKSDHKTPATKPEDDGYSLAGDPDNRQSTCVDNVYEDVESKQSDGKAKSVNLNSKDKKPVSNSKADEGVYKNIGEVGTLSSTSSPYEPMTPIPIQSIYANESAVPFRTESLTSSLGSGSEAHTPYCEMRSPSVKLKDDGARMLVDNELYSA